MNSHYYSQGIVDSKIPSPKNEPRIFIIVKIINFIKPKALYRRCFNFLCEETGSEHQHFLFYTEVCWLSRGKVLQRLFELRDEVKLFLIDKLDLADYLCNSKFLATLAYLADIFEKLNSLNISLQGNMTTILIKNQK